MGQGNILRARMLRLVRLFENEQDAYAALFYVCLLLSLGGIILCAAFPNWDVYGGVGGALAVSLALAMAWVTIPLGNEYLDVVIKEAPSMRDRLEIAYRVPTDSGDSADGKDGGLTTLERQVSALLNARKLDAEGARSEYTWLAAATAIGTLAGGFGPLASLALSQVIH